MKIAITGTHGTGKTTVAKILANAFGYPLITNVARHAIRDAGFENTDDYIKNATTQTKRIVQSKILYMQHYMEQAAGDAFVADRSVVDAVAYAYAYKLAPYDLAGLTAEMERFAQHYDLLVYLPPTIPFSDDGFRPTEDAFRKEVQDHIEHLVFGRLDAIFPGRIMLLPEHDLDRRIKKIRRALDHIINDRVERDFLAFHQRPTAAPPDSTAAVDTSAANT